MKKIVEEKKDRKKSGPAPGTGGRPPKKLDIKLLTKLCEIQCTVEEIEAVLEISRDAINRKLTQSHNMTFKTFFKEKRKKGKQSLRRALWSKAISDDPKNNNMGIFFAKQHLGMTDKIDQTVITEKKKTKNQKLLENMSTEDILKELEIIKSKKNAAIN